MKIEANAVYTSEETSQILKISQSTFKRLVKKGIIRSVKIGGRYRILGKHILHMLSPALEQKAAGVYSAASKTVKKWEEGEHE